MSDEQRLIVRVAADGTISAETQGIKGEKCLDYIETLENLLDAVTQSSSFTPEFHEQPQATATEVSNDLRQF